MRVVAEELALQVGAEPAHDARHAAERARAIRSGRPHVRHPRFHALYGAWLERGEPVLDATLSPVLRDAIDRGNGRINHQVLPHAYLHLAPLVGTVLMTVGLPVASAA